jgi:hypothetical protein
MNNILDLIDFERRGEYVLSDVKSTTWFFEWTIFFFGCTKTKIVLNIIKKKVAYGP